MNQKVINITLEGVSKEWDAICDKREQTISEGKDISLLYVTAPCVLRNLQTETRENVIDIGCGTGYITDQISSICNCCYGIDASGRSIQIAKNKYKKSNLFFLQSTISRFQTDIQFDSCVANMVFMTDPELLKSLRHIYTILRDSGALLITITHPCFWPVYWNYVNEPWFDYNKEIFIEHDFCTSMSETIGVTTHIHRPLSMYFEIIKEAGFDIETIEEPAPVIGTPHKYRYEYPRFLFIKCRKPGIR